VNVNEGLCMTYVCLFFNFQWNFRQIDKSKQYGRDDDHRSYFWLTFNTFALLKLTHDNSIEHSTVIIRIHHLRLFLKIKNQPNPTQPNLSNTNGTIQFVLLCIALYSSSHNKKYFLFAYAI
jgi:hypothetical protein